MEQAYWGDLRSPWLLTTYESWDDPPSMAYSWSQSLIEPLTLGGKFLGSQPPFREPPFQAYCSHFFKADMGDYRAISVLIDMLGDKEFSEGSSYLWYPSKINLTPEKVVFQSLNQHFSGPKDWFYLQSRYFFTENQCLWPICPSFKCKNQILKARRISSIYEYLGLEKDDASNALELHNTYCRAQIPSFDRHK